MSLFIPDVLIVDTFNKILNILREDYKANINANTEERNILYLLFKGNAIGKYDFYENAKSLIITTPRDPLHLEVRLSYDHTSTGWNNMVYITLAAETAANNSMSIGEGDQDELLFDNAAPSQDDYKKQFMRRYATSYSIVILAKNRNEMLVLFNLFKALTSACINHLSLSGLSKIQIGGQDIKYNAEPIGLFARAINLSFDYEQTAPELLIKKVYNKIKVNLVADDSEL